MRYIIRDADGNELRRMSIPDGEDPELQLQPGERAEPIIGGLVNAK